MSKQISEYLQDLYEYKVVKVGANTNKINKNYIKKVKKGYRFFGLLPKYEYKTYNIELSNWVEGTVNYSGLLDSPNKRIAICVDDDNKTVYWKYII